MSSATVRAIAAGMITVIASVICTPWSPATVHSSDACPEPNDDFQAACFVGVGSDALGVLSNADDVDAYRFETFDADVRASIRLVDLPAPYRFGLADWNGRRLDGDEASPGAESVETVLPAPGSYYIFVQSPTGEFSPTAPYRLNLVLTYPYAQEMHPQLRFSQEFREPTYLGWKRQLDDAPLSADADFFDVGGRFSIRVNKTGIAEDWPRVSSPPFGPVLDDFILTADTRVEDLDGAKGHVGYRIGFRWGDPYHQYSVVVDVEGRRVWLNKVNGSSMKDTVPLTEPYRTRAIDNRGGVNRTVIRCVGDDIQISINGESVIHVVDSTFRGGAFNLVAAAWGSGRPLVSFDNVLITTPPGR